MATNLTNISSQYNMIEILQNISKNYFGDSISEQRIGMFGYTTEALANIFGAVVLDSSNRQSEYLASTAKKRSTLLKEASKINDTIDNAIPAYADGYLGIYTDDINTKTMDGGFGITVDQLSDELYFVIEKGTVIMVQNIKFMIEHDILIKSTKNSAGKHSYSVTYLLEGDYDPTTRMPDGELYKTPRSNSAYEYPQYVDNYLSDILIDSDTGLTKELLIMKVKLVQVECTSTIYPIVQNDIISLTGLDFFYPNNLAYFNVFYRKNSTHSWNNILAIPDWDNADNYDEDVIYYEVDHDLGRLRLNIIDFNPDYNSEIRLDIYSTLGAEVNGRTYTGTGNDIIVDLRSIDERHSYIGISLSCGLLTDIDHGKNLPTLEELRKKVINLKQSVNSINTDYDMRNYLYGKLGDDDAIFVKKQDDILERRYSMYTIMRDYDGSIIPTSVLNLWFPFHEEELKQAFNMSSNTQYEYNILQKICVLLNKVDMDRAMDFGFTIKAGTPFMLNNDAIEDGSIEGTELSKRGVISDTIATENDTDLDDHPEYKKFYMTLLYDAMDNAASFNKVVDNYRVFTSPYSIVYDNVNKLTSYYMSSIDKTVNFTMIEENENSYLHFNIASFTIKRYTSLGNDVDISTGTYDIQLSVTMNGDYSRVFTKNSVGDNVFRPNSVIPVVYFYDDILENRSPIERIELEYDSDAFNSAENGLTFKGQIVIDDNIMDNKTTVVGPRKIIDDSDSDNIVERLYYGSYRKSSEGNSVHTVALNNLTVTIAFYFFTPEIEDDNGIIPIDDMEPLYQIPDKHIYGKYIVNTQYVPNEDDDDDKYTVDESLLTIYRKNGIASVDYLFSPITIDKDEPKIDEPSLIDDEGDILEENVAAFNRYKYTICNVYANLTDKFYLLKDMSAYLKSYSTQDSKVLYDEDSETNIDWNLITIMDIPLMKYTQYIDSSRYWLKRVISSISNMEYNLDDMRQMIANNFFINYNFFRTYGPCINYTLEKPIVEYTTDKVDIGNIDISIKFVCLAKSNTSRNDTEIRETLKTFIKNKIESMNSDDYYTVYISNIISEIESTYSSFVRSIELRGISYDHRTTNLGEGVALPEMMDATYRVIRYNDIANLDSDTVEQYKLKHYAPEYINLPKENIIIDIRYE